MTSLNNSEAENFGHEEHLEHDLRYDRADEFMEVVTGLWDSWEDDALIVDKQSGRFADPDKVHRLDHDGKYFKSKGPLTVPRSAQGHPVLLQAGQSGRGMAFAGRWAELVFASYPSLEAGRKNYAHLKGEVDKAGRDPSTGEDRAGGARSSSPRRRPQAEEQRAIAASTGQADRPAGAAVRGAERRFLQAAATTSRSPTRSWPRVSWQSLRDQVIAKSGKKNPSVRDFVEASGRGTLQRRPGVLRHADARSPTRCRNGSRRACDGFVLSATHDPGRLRGHRAPGRARAAAARPVPDGSIPERRCATRWACRDRRRIAGATMTERRRA